MNDIERCLTAVKVKGCCAVCNKKVKRKSKRKSKSKSKRKKSKSKSKKSKSKSKKYIQQKKSVCKRILYNIHNNNINFTCPICEKKHSTPSLFTTTEVYYESFISNGITHLHDANEEKQYYICETTGKKIKLIKKQKCKNCDWYYPKECNDNEVIIEHK